LNYFLGIKYSKFQRQRTHSSQIYKVKKMSVFGKIFGGKSSKPEPTTQGALQELSEQEEMLIKKQEYLNKKIETVSLNKFKGICHQNNILFTLFLVTCHCKKACHNKQEGGIEGFEGKENP
jgi:hypothetical protein